MKSLGIRASIVLISTVAVSAWASLAPVTAQTHVPNLNGVWAREAHNYPKPYAAPGRGGGIRDGYNNEYLKPWVVELLNRDALVTRSGQAVSNPHAICYPESVPAVFGGAVMQILQTPTEITFLFADPGQFRTVHLNQQHPKDLVPSYWGHSIGHFEGDTLVVDTI